MKYRIERDGTIVDLVFFNDAGTIARESMSEDFLDEYRDPYSNELDLDGLMLDLDMYDGPVRLRDDDFKGGVL